MILAYHLSPHDDGTYMLGEETYRPPRSAGSYDWRFGVSGVPHPATCATCGRKTDPDYINPNYRAKRRGWDIATTYDGYDIVSRRFRLFCEEHDWGGVEFVPLPADDEFFVLRLSGVLPFDAERRQTRFENLCPLCGSYYNVIGATPAYFRGVTEPIKEGIFRSDLEFGSGPEQSPLIFVGTQTFAELRGLGFKKYATDPVES